MKPSVVTLTIVLLAFEPLSLDGACPSDGQEAARQLSACRTQLNEITDYRKGPFSASQLDNYCKSTARKDELQCMEQVIDDCRQTSPTIRRILDKAVNINAVRSSINILCSNTQIFAEKQDCIGRYRSRVVSCITSEYSSYNSRLKSYRSEVRYKGIDWFEEKAYEELCDYVGEVAYCQRPFGQNCGREIGDVFDAIVHAVTPPVCADFIYNSGLMEHVNLILMISLAVVAVVKRTV